MIKFFRKIRQKLFSEGKLKNYFLYAIGEIVLIVIGILIALQINNWNLERISTSKAENYRTFLIRDIVNEISTINFFIEFEKQIQEIGIVGLEDFEKLSSSALLDTIIGLPSRRTLTILNPTYEDLIHTGNIDLFTNQSLRDAIINHYQKLEYISNVIEKNNTYILDQVIRPGLFELEIRSTIDTEMIKSLEDVDLAFLNRMKKIYPTFGVNKNDEQLRKRKIANLIRLRLTMSTVEQSLARQALKDAKALRDLLKLENN